MNRLYLNVLSKRLFQLYVFTVLEYFSLACILDQIVKTLSYSNLPAMLREHITGPFLINVLSDATGKI